MYYLDHLQHPPKINVRVVAQSARRDIEMPLTTSAVSEPMTVKKGLDDGEQKLQQTCLKSQTRDCMRRRLKSHTSGNPMFSTRQHDSQLRLISA